MWTDTGCATPCIDILGPPPTPRQDGLGPGFVCAKRTRFCAGRTAFLLGREALEAKAKALQSHAQGLVFTKACPVYQTKGFGYGERLRNSSVDFIAKRRPLLLGRNAR